MPIESVVFFGWPNCFRLSNRETEIIVATDIGLRVLRFGFIGKPNAFYLDPETLGSTGGDEWRIYGGHRLWQAPETFPGSYSPDNAPVTSRVADDRLIITQPVDPATGLVKEMEIRLDSRTNSAEVIHRLTNKNKSAVRFAPWAISVMTPGGTAVIPQEPYGEGNDFLLPARTLALWSYTKMSDKRWTWGDRYISARQDRTFTGEQKIGVLNRPGWSVYFFAGHCFIKKFGFQPDAGYADMGCNNDIYFNERFLEIESLGPLADIAPDATTEHREQWSLENLTLPEDEPALDRQLSPLVAKSGQG